MIAKAKGNGGGSATAWMETVGKAKSLEEAERTGIV